MRSQQNIQGTIQSPGSYLPKYNDAVPCNGRTSCDEFANGWLTIKPNLQQAISIRPRGTKRVPGVWLVVQTLVYNFFIVDKSPQSTFVFIPDEQNAVGEGGRRIREEDMVPIQIIEGPVNVVAPLSQKKQTVLCYCLILLCELYL